MRIGFALLLIALLVLQTSSASAQSAQPDEASIIRGIDAAVKARLDGIAGYSVNEHYAVYRGSDHTNPIAERTVKTTYRNGVGKDYVIVADSGSPMVRRLVLDAILENEKRINTPEATKASYIISANYDMKLKPGGPQRLNGRDCYVLTINPKVKAPNLIIGTLWVDTKDESIVQIEGTNSRSVSVLTGPTRVMRQYVSIDGFAEATHATGASTSFLFGAALVTIDYQNYELHLRHAQ